VSLKHTEQKCNRLIYRHKWI